MVGLVPEKGKNKKRFGIRIVLISLCACAIGVISAFYFAFCPLLNERFFNAILFTHPRFIPEKDLLFKHADTDSKTVSILSSDGKSKLNGQLHLRKGATKIAILSHGKGENIFSGRFKTQNLLDAEVSVLAYDYRGYGLSGGKTTMNDVVEDLVVAYEWVLNNTEYTPKQIVLYGESVGSGITSDAMSRIDCGAVVLDSAFVSVESMAKERIPVLNIYPSFLFPKPGLDNMAMVTKEHPPLLMVAGALDVEVPVRHTKRLYTNASEPKQMLILKNGRHVYYEKDREEFVSTLKQFFNSI